jgi:hypothetical protein
MVQQGGGALTCLAHGKDTNNVLREYLEAANGKHALCGSVEMH